MNTIKRDVYVLRNTIKIPIEVTKGTDVLGLEFAVRDYEVPATAAAVAYVYHKSMDIFTAIVQGILVAGLSNYVNQLIKQMNKDE